MSEMVPEGWDLCAIGNHIEVLTDYTANGSFASLKENVKYYNEKNYAALVRTTDLEKDIFSPKRFTDKKGYEFLAKTSLKNGDIVIANVGSTGKAYCVPDAGMPMTLAPNMYLVKFKNSLNNSFSFQLITNEKFYNDLISQTGSSTLNAINKSNFRNIIVLIPPLPEQKKIASILTSVDEVIEKTQLQIDKLQDLKKGMMNELLTKGIGHTEFKDSELGRIPKSWNAKKLGDLSDIFFSNVNKKTEEGESNVLLCNYMDVYSNRNINKKIEFMKATANQREIDKFLISKGDVMITKDSETPGDIAVPSYVSEELENVLCGYHLALIRPDKNNLSGIFLSYLFSLEIIQHRYYQLANGSTRFGLTTEVITNSPLPIPPLIEQEKIASIITSVDEKIEKLEKRLQQKQFLKKSLMQDLLTGKVRVSIN